MNTEFPPLKVEACPDGLITLTDPIADGYGNEWSVRIHPEQLRWIAQQAGLVREVSASDADMLATERGRAADALRRVGRLGRRMRTLHERILLLDKWLWEQPDHEQADITLEVHYSGATMDLSTEFLKEFEEDDEAASRHETPTSAMKRQATPGNAASKAAPKPPIGEGMDAARGNAASVTQALVERYPGVTNAASALEREAMNTFRSFVREKAALLRVVAHWGDGECGALLDVLKAELLSRGTPEGRTPDAAETPMGTESAPARNRPGPAQKTQAKPSDNPAGSGQLPLEDGQ